jgi:hypothetical protein
VKGTGGKKGSSGPISNPTSRIERGVSRLGWQPARLAFKATNFGENGSIWVTFCVRPDDEAPDMKLKHG